MGAITTLANSDLVAGAQPDKTALTALFALIDTIVSGNTGNINILLSAQGGGRLGYDTLAHLNADLAHAANQIAEVLADGTTANNGVYIKVGGTGTGSWTQLSTLTLSSLSAALTAAAASIASLNTGLASETSRATAAEAALAVFVNPAILNILFPINDRMQDSAQDSSARASDYLSLAGDRYIAGAKIRVLNNVRPEALILGQKYGAGDKLGFMAFMPNCGQSLAETHAGGGNLTVTQEGNSLAFGGLGSTTMYPALATDIRLSTVVPYTLNADYPPPDGENPMFGVCGFFYELLLKENGLNPSDMAFTPVTANNSAGSTGIADNNKGTTRYGYGQAQVAALRTYALANNAMARTFGMAWWQGEFNAPDTFASYYASLVRLARDYATDSRAIMTEQTFDPHLCTYQMNSRADGGNRFSVSRAQLQAAIDFINGVVPSGHSVPAPVGFSTPNYFMDRGYDDTGVHIPARDAKWMGGYAALYWKRKFIDLLPWPPMYPLSIIREGNSLFVKFQMRSPGVKFVLANSTGTLLAPPDGHTIPPQPNAGWSGYNTNTSAAITLSSVAIVGPDTLRISLSTAPVNGMRFDYGQGVAVDMSPFTFSAGNLRDNYGDFVFYDSVNRPMHNWLPVQSLLLDSSGAGFSMA